MRVDRRNSSTQLRPGRFARRVRGGSSIEYMLILALVVIPIALLGPLILQMINTYAGRIGLIIRLPFG
jgi:hypothetical protein